MQYLLTPEEYNKLKQASDELARLKAKGPNTKELQKVCTKIANEMPIKFWGRKEAAPWRCVITLRDEWYCDECPVQTICPYEHKSWSK